MAWLIHARPWSPSAGALVDVYLSDGGFTSEPSDTPPNKHWQRRVEVPLSVRRSLWSGSSIGGRSDAELGAVVAGNDDGALDAWDSFDWDGRFVEIRHSDLDKPALADFSVVFSGTAERFTLSDTQASIEISDLQAVTDKPFQTRKFLGTGGIEGPLELKDRRRPRTLGVCRSIEPVLISAAYQVYAYSDGPSGGILAAWDGGDPFDNPGLDYPTWSALVAASTVSVDYITCNALGLIRLGGQPNKVLILDVAGRLIGGSPIASFPSLAQFILTTDTTLTGADFAPGAVAAGDALMPQTLGFWFDGSGDVAVREVIDQLAGSVGGYWGFDETRRIDFGRFDGPAISPDHRFGEREIIALEPRSYEQRLKALTLKYGRRHRPLSTGDFAGSVSDTDKAKLSADWQRYEATDAGTAAASLLSREEERETLLDDAAQAAAEGTRQLAIYSPRRRAFDLTVELDNSVRVGQTVEVTFHRFGLDTGRLMAVLELARDAVEGTMTLTVWG